MSSISPLLEFLTPATTWAARQPWWMLASLAFGSLLVAVALWAGATYFYNRRLHHLAHIPGGKPAHWLLGDLPKAMSMPTGALADEKLKLYGPTFRNHQILGAPSLVTIDHTAISYIQQHPDLFIKPPSQTEVLARFLGFGLVMAEHEQHRRQRRVLNQSFSASAVREMMPFFYQKVYEMRDHIADQVDGVEDPQEEGLPPLAAVDVVPGARKVDMAIWLNKVTFDVIGLAGFDVDFACLSKGNEVVDLFRAAIAEVMRLTPINILQNLMPYQFNWIPSKRNRQMDMSRASTQKVGRELVARKKVELRALQCGGNVEKDTVVGKDILSLIVKANMAADLPANQRLSDEEIIDQVSTFILAGSETSSNGVAWTLLRLAQNPKFQDRLREELYTVQDSEPSLETLNSLPFLEACVRESLRVDSPVPDTLREATESTVLPLGIPIVGKDGKEISAVQLKKGDVIIPILVNVNRDSTVWGEDAHEFNPERFDRPGIPMRTVPGTYGNLITFNGGPRNCIGYRFAIAEMKVLLFVLLRTFTFELLPSKPEVTQKSYIVMLPWVVGEEEYGSQLPLLLRPVDRE